MRMYLYHRAKNEKELEKSRIEKGRDSKAERKNKAKLAELEKAETQEQKSIVNG